MSRGEPLNRQWKLLKAMQAVHYGLCADDLAQRLECSKRQVLRDLKVLQELGFPISYQERDFGKRYWKLSAQNQTDVTSVLLAPGTGENLHPEPHLLKR